MRNFIIALLTVFCLSSGVSADDFVLGLIPEMNVFKQTERHRPLAEYLSKKLNINVELKILPRYGNILDSFKASKMDAAFWGSFTGALAIKKLGVKPLARPLQLDQTSTYKGYLFTRKDSGIDSTAKLKGKSFAFVDRATTAGFLFPISILKKQGTRLADLDKYFSSYFFTGSHDAAIMAVLNGEADAGAAKNTIFDMMAGKNPDIRNKIRILAESSEVPSNTLGVRKDLDPSLTEKIKATILNMDKDPEGVKVLKEFGAVKFISTGPADFDPVLGMAENAGLDLSSYDYLNH